MRGEGGGRDWDERGTESGCAGVGGGKKCAALWVEQGVLVPGYVGGACVCLARSIHRDKWGRSL
jgi:hypothetical protein